MMTAAVTLLLAALAAHLVMLAYWWPVLDDPEYFWRKQQIEQAWVAWACALPAAVNNEAWE